MIIFVFEYVNWWHTYQNLELPHVRIDVAKVGSKILHIE